MIAEPQNHKDAKDLAVGALLNFVGMVAKVSKVLFVFVAARFYGTEAFGLYVLAWTAVDLASKLGLWGMDRSLIRDIARYNSEQSEATKDKIFGMIRFNISAALGLSVLVACALFFISPLIAEVIFNEPTLTLPLRILAMALPTVVLTHALIATTKALRLMQYEVLIRQTLEPLALFVGACLLIPLQLGAKGLVAAHLGASVVAAVTAFMVVFRKYRYLGWRRKPLAAEIKRETIRYATPLAFMDFLNLLVVRADVMLVGALMNTASAGLYGIAVEIISVIKRIRQGFEPIFSPIVSELFYGRQRDRLRRNYVLVTRWLMAGSFLPVTAMLIFPDQILGFFSVHSSQVALALMILAISHGLFGTFSASESLLIMTGRSLLNAVLAAIMFVLNCSLTAVLIKQFGLAGAALGTFAALTTVTITRLYYVKRLLHLHPFGFSLLWPLTTAGVTLLGFYLIGNWLTIASTAETIFTLTAMMFVYGVIYFSGATEPEEKQILTTTINKLKRKPAVLRA